MKPPLISGWTSETESGSPTNTIPPELRSWKLSSFWFLLLIVAALAIARFGEWSAMPWPRCGFRLLTGIPCPFCGTTRCLIALSHLELKEALSFNPLVLACLFLAVPWIALTPSKERFDAGLNKLLQRPWIWFWLALVLLNWIYLVRYLP